MIETEGLGLSSFRLSVATVRDMAHWTIEVHREFDRKYRECYVRECLADTNWWRRLFFMKELTYAEMVERIERESRESHDVFKHWRYSTGEPTGVAIDISKNLLKSCDQTTDGHVTITVRDFSYLAVRPKR